MQSLTLPSPALVRAFQRASGPATKGRRTPQEPCRKTAAYRTGEHAPDLSLRAWHALPQGIDHLSWIATVVEDGESDLPEMACIEWQDLLKQITEMTTRIATSGRRIKELAGQADVSCRLQTMVGVGPLTALVAEAFAPPMESFKCGRDFAAGSFPCSSRRWWRSARVCRRRRASWQDQSIPLRPDGAGPWDYGRGVGQIVLGRSARSRRPERL